MMNGNNGTDRSAAGPTLSTLHRKKIAETVALSRVTIVVGPTGCGKSTLVPPLLLDALTGRVLCSQPRRLAVVAIAKRVAEQRRVKLGGQEVGYHVGNHNLSTKKTKLLFTTAGILLEELRNNGVDALTAFSCVVIDECHERSPESDLTLALIKDFMKKNRKAKIRLVLMSATFDHKRYTHYFRDVPGCEKIDTVNLETAQSWEAFHNQVKVYYLDGLPLSNDVLKIHRPFLEQMQKNPNADLKYEAGRELSPGLLSLIRTIVSSLDKSEPMASPFLIFAPTYAHLEQLYHTISYLNGSLVDLSVLHSAVDIEDCIRTMTSSRRTKSRRLVFLASAIADSSVTVPGVSCVIDLCRSLQVRWDLDGRTYAAKTTWSSQSIADQRRGRTGRTCAGTVFRMVTEGFYKKHLPLWDVPQLTMNACYDEVLKMIASNEKASVGDPRVFLASCLDPPAQDVVTEAIAYLEGISACQEVQNFYGLRTGKISPTDFGSLLSTMAMNVDDARVVLEGGRLGLLYETLAFVAILKHKPSPIVHVFGDGEKNHAALKSFYPNVANESSHSVAIANLSAYMFWDIHWNQAQNKRNLQAFDQVTRSLFDSSSDEHLEGRNTWRWTEETEQNHIEWCKEHNINPTSMRSITEIIETTLNVLFLSRHEPTWLRCADPTPRWRRRSDWRVPHMDPDSYGKDVLPLVYGDRSSSLCLALSKLATTRSALSSRSLAESFLGMTPTTMRLVHQQNQKRPVACVHFLMGNCIYGTSCRASHSPHARRPLCKFYSNGTCSKGSRCIYSHEDPDDLYASEINDMEHSPSDPLVPLIASLEVVGGALAWFKRMSDCVFMLGEGNFQFTNALTALGIPPAVTSSDVSSAQSRPNNALLFVDATSLHRNPVVIRKVKQLGMTMRSFAWAWNFPFIGSEEDTSANELLILLTFQSLSLLRQEISVQCGRPIFALSLQGDQFSRWNVLRSAGRTGWGLVSWCDFDYKSFPGYRPCRQNGDTFPVDNAKFYVFRSLD